MKIHKQISQRWNPFSDFVFDCKSEIRILNSRSWFPNRTHPKFAACARVIADKKRQARESPKYKSDRYLFSDFESIDVSHLCFKKRTWSVFSFLAECQHIICWYCNRSEHRLFLRVSPTAFGEEGKNSRCATNADCRLADKRSKHCCRMLRTDSLSLN